MRWVVLFTWLVVASQAGPEGVADVGVADVGVTDRGLTDQAVADQGVVDQSWLPELRRAVYVEALRTLRPLLQIKPTDFVHEAVYQSHHVFSNAGMKPIYSLVSGYIKWVGEEQPFPEGYITLGENKTLKMIPITRNKGLLLKHYKKAAVFIYFIRVLVIILVILCITLIILFFAFLNRELLSGFEVNLIKSVLSILLLALLGLSLVGMVMALSEARRSASALAALPGVVRAAADDVAAYIHDARRHAQYHLIDAYEELLKQVEPVLNALSPLVSTIMRKSLRHSAGARARPVWPGSLAALFRMLGELERVRADLAAAADRTRQLRQDADRLNADLVSVKSQVLAALAACREPQCAQLHRTKLAPLDFQIQFTQIPDVGELLANVTELLETNLTSELLAGKQSLRQMKLEMVVAVERSKPKLELILEETGAQLHDMSNKMKAAGDALVSAVQIQRGVVIDKIVETRNNLEPKRLLSAVGVPLMVLLISVVLVVGLVTAWIDKGIGSWLLLGGSVVCCVLGSFVLVTAAIYYALSVGCQRVFCEPTLHPRIGNRLWDLIEQAIDVEESLYHVRTDPDFTFARILQRCHSNMTVYNVLDLHRAYDMEYIQEQVKMQIYNAIGIFPNSTDPEAEVGNGTARGGGPGVGGARGRRGSNQLMSDSTALQLRRLADLADTEFDFDALIAALAPGGAVSRVPLARLAAQLAAAADSLQQQRQPAPELVARRLRGAARLLRALEQDAVAAITRNVYAINATALRVREWLRTNCSQHRRELLRLLVGSRQMGGIQWIIDAGTSLANSVLDAVVTAFTNMLVGYFNRAVEQAGSEIGRCGPLSNAYNVSRLAICQNMLYPNHGFWVSLAAAGVLLVPAAAAAALLTLLFQGSSADSDGGFSLSGFTLPNFSLQNFSLPRLSKPSFGLFNNTLRKMGKNKSNYGRSYGDDASCVGEGSGEGSSCCPTSAVVLAVAVAPAAARCPCLPLRNKKLCNCHRSNPVSTNLTPVSNEATSALKSDLGTGRMEDLILSDNTALARRVDRRTAVPRNSDPTTDILTATHLGITEVPVSKHRPYLVPR